MNGSLLFQGVVALIFSKNLKLQIIQVGLDFKLNINLEIQFEFSFELPLIQYIIFQEFLYFLTYKFFNFSIIPFYQNLFKFLRILLFQKDVILKYFVSPSFGLFISAIVNLHLVERVSALLIYWLSLVHYIILLTIIVLCLH